MRRRPRRYKTRPPRGVRWMHFRQRLRHVLGFGRQRHSPAPVTELDDVILESAHADGQRILESARDRAVEIEATAVERALSLSSEADAIVAEARANAAEILGDAEKVARDYLVALDSLLGERDHDREGEPALAHADVRRAGATANGNGLADRHAADPDVVDLRDAEEPVHGVVDLRPNARSNGSAEPEPDEPDLDAVGEPDGPEHHLEPLPHLLWPARPRLVVRMDDESLFGPEAMAPTPEGNRPKSSR